MEKKKIRKPVQNRSITKKEKLIEAGIELFSKEGYYETNTKKISKLAGVGVGSFYDYFKDKKDLLITILIRHRREMSKQMTSIKLAWEIDKDKVIAYEEKKIFIKRFVDSVMKFHDSASMFHSKLPKLRLEDKDVDIIVSKWEISQIEILDKIIKNPVLGFNYSHSYESATMIYRLVEDTAHLTMLISDEREKMRLREVLVLMIESYLLR